MSLKIGFVFKQNFIFFSYTQHFDICIIDEATQCTEPWSLMPLQFGIKHFILVGDTQQLPATVTSMVILFYEFREGSYISISNHVYSLSSAYIL